MPLANHYVDTAAEIVTEYDGSVPFHHIIKQFFASRRKYGSRDRKIITNACYNYFRLGEACENLPVKERIILGEFLCSKAPHKLIATLRPAWAEKLDAPLEEKLRAAQTDPAAFHIFPFATALSDGMDKIAFDRSFLVQPGVFIRIRPGQHKNVLAKLKAAAIPFEQLAEDTIALPPATRLDDVLAINSGVVVQDLNSQQAGKVVQELLHAKQMAPKNMWDCCAASGGKSIMMHDIFPALHLTVSDVRPSILHNLAARFKEAGIKKYNSFVADISKQTPQLPGNVRPDILLADVPCSGSGTWARTPEQMFYFDREKINTYAALQRNIVKNALPALLPGGILIYITCSVFAAENEQNILFFEKEHGLELLGKKLLTGYDKSADSMFVAIMRNT